MEIVQTMYEQNVRFLKEVEEAYYNIHRFAHKMLRGRWSGLSVVRFLAFGARKEFGRQAILDTLRSEYPEWKAELTWTNLLWELE